MTNLNLLSSPINSESAVHMYLHQVKMLYIIIGNKGIVEQLT